MNKKELKSFLDDKARAFEYPQFLEQDPIQIPHRFNKKEDIEIAGFLIATIAWGNRVSIIKSGNRMMDFMDNDPHHFVMGYNEADLKPLKNFVHRTFNGIDFIYFLKALRNIYRHHKGLESAFSQMTSNTTMYENIHLFKKTFFELEHEKRTEKHISDPFNGSAAKRLNMYLRWMVRPATMGVDFGIWKRITPAQLSCPLDVHTGNVARAMDLLYRKQNDQKALQELDDQLRTYDPSDPIKYDFALFGLGVYENFGAKITH